MFFFVRESDWYRGGMRARILSEMPRRVTFFSSVRSFLFSLSFSRFIGQLIGGLLVITNRARAHELIHECSLVIMRKARERFVHLIHLLIITRANLLSRLRASHVREINEKWEFVY